MSYLNNDIAITQGGNAIVKSKGGQKAGTAVGVMGAATSVAALALPADKFIKGGVEAIGGKNCLQAIRNFIKGTNTKLFGTKLTKLPKAGRTGFVVGMLTTMIAAPILVYRGLGKLIDKSVNKHRAKYADAQALIYKFNS